MLEGNLFAKDLTIDKLIAELDALKETVNDHKDVLEDAYDEGMIETHYFLFKEFKDGKINAWEIDEVIHDYEMINKGNQ